MFVNLTSLENGAHAEFCVIGSGPAGMTVARKLAAAGRKVFLFEGGGEEISEESQDIYKGTVAPEGRYRPLDISRLRYLGGTSNHWGGLCYALSPETFLGSVPLGEWPIRKKDLDPYTKEAQKILDVKFSKHYEKFFFNDRDSYMQMQVGLSKFSASGNEPTSTRFLEKYHGDLQRNSNLFVFLNSNLIALDTNGERVTAARFSNYEGLEKTVRAHNYILAIGGIENNRILLYNNFRQRGRLVKSSHVLGKYFMDHPETKIGVLGFFPDQQEKLEARRYYLLNDFRKRHSMVNLLPIFFKANRESEIKFLKNELDFFNSFLLPIQKIHTVHATLEIAPRKENLISLLEEKDRFGIHRVKVSISASPEESRAVSVFCKFLGRYVIDKEIGRLKVLRSGWRWHDYPIDWWGNHHMGGTRMASSPEWGVVDKNCLVFGQKNLYIAGSSVFPSGDAVTPTYTIVQLALRLSAHLLSLRA